MRILPNCALALIACSSLIFGQSPGAEASATIGGKPITIKYSAPSVRGRQIFGDGGVVSKDSTYPVWRAGANAATTLETGADLDIAGLNVPGRHLYALRPGEGPRKMEESASASATRLVRSMSAMIARG